MTTYKLKKKFSSLLIEIISMTVSGKWYAYYVAAKRIFTLSKVTCRKVSITEEFQCKIETSYYCHRGKLS